MPEKLTRLRVFNKAEISRASIFKANIVGNSFFIKYSQIIIVRLYSLLNAIVNINLPNVKLDKL